jgi:CheY-like chemotaxis protein
MNMMTMPSHSSSTQQSSMPTVLVVEDEVMVRMPIAEYLRDCGYNVVEACDADEAIAAVAESGPVNLVFSDVRMPGRMDGFGLAEWFRTNHPDVPVLLTSGYNTSRGVARDTSGVRLIEKPYSQIQVARRIAALLER